MPFTDRDLDKISVRVGTRQMPLRAMSSQQFTAWLRARGYRGMVNALEGDPGEYEVTGEERVRLLNELTRLGLPVYEGEEPATDASDEPLDYGDFERLAASVRLAISAVEEAVPAAQALGDFDPTLAVGRSLESCHRLLTAVDEAIARNRSRAR